MSNEHYQKKKKTLFFWTIGCLLIIVLGVGVIYFSRKDNEKLSENKEQNFADIHFLKKELNSIKTSLSKLPDTKQKNSLKKN